MTVGKTYLIKHSRKGTFTAELVEDQGEWVKLKIIKGIAEALMDYNIQYVDDLFCTRKSLIDKWEETK